MQIYYNDMNNELLLTNEKRFKLGQLLIDYIGLDFDRIIEFVNNELTLVLPNSKAEINRNISKIEEFFEKLTNIHLYFSDYEHEVKEYFDEYAHMSRLYYKLNDILAFDDAWFQNNDNIEHWYDVFTNTLYIEKLTNDIKTDAKKAIEETENRIKLSINGIKNNINIYKNVHKKFYKVIDYCFNSRDYTSLKDLSPIKRYHLFLNTQDKDFKNITISLEYRTNTVENLEIDLTTLVNLTNRFNESLRLLRQNEVTIYELYEVNIKSACYLELIKLLPKNIPIIKCDNCHKYFISKGRSDTLYCDRIIDKKGRTCKDVGAINAYKNKINDDPIMKLYNKVYKRQSARVRYKKITNLEFYIWSEKARDMRDKAKNGEITFEELNDWLENN